MKKFRIFLLILIVIGIALICTQKFWVPKLVDKILQSEKVPRLSKPSEASKHFIDKNNTFSFDYNPLFNATEDKEGVSVLVPKSYMPGTNFSEASLKVTKSNDADVLKTCMEKIPDAKIIGSKILLDGVPFVGFGATDAGAGNFYETITYKGLAEGNCYTIAYTIHSTNIGNYSPDQGIKEFDKVKIQTELESIVSSIKFSA